MSTMIAEVYDAFKDAGANDDKGRAAAEAVANFQLEIGKIGKDIVEMRGDIKLVKWLIALVIVVQIVPLLQNYSS